MYMYIYNYELQKHQMVYHNDSKWLHIWFSDKQIYAQTHTEELEIWPIPNYILQPSELNGTGKSCSKSEVGVLWLKTDHRHTFLRLGQAHSYHWHSQWEGWTDLSIKKAPWTKQSSNLCNKLVCIVYQILSSELFLLKIKILHIAKEINIWWK